MSRMLEVDVLPAPVVAQAHDVAQTLVRNAGQRMEEERALEERALEEAGEEEESITAEF